MTDKLFPGEETLFFLINGSHTHFMDGMMWTFSSIKIWIPIAICVIACIVYKKPWKQYVPILILLILLFAVCDQFSSHLIKPLIVRPRPTHYPGIMEHVNTLFNYRAGSYGFISGHATNSFGFAMFTALLFKNKFYTGIVFLWAAIVGYSRIYIGVHFVSDVLGGIISGMLIGYAIYALYRYGIKKISVRNSSCKIAVFSEHQTRLLTIVVCSYLVLITIFSSYLVTFL